MLVPLRLAATVAALLASTGAFAQPIPVRLPKNAPPKGANAPRELEPDAAKGPDRKAMHTKGLYLLDFDKVDIDKLVQTISDMTGKLFILPENIRGKITIIGPEHGKVGVTVDEAYAAFLAALDANGLTLYPVGKYLKITDKRSGKQSNIPTLLDDGPYTVNEQMVTKFFKLRYVEAEPVRGVVQQLVSKDGDVIAFPPDSLIVNDIGLNLHRIEKIVEKLDTASSNDEIRIIAVHYASANDVAAKIQQVFEERNRRPGQRPGQAAMPGMPPPQISSPFGVPPSSAPAAGDESPAILGNIIADERTNKLIITANEKAFRRITELLAHLDQPIPGEGQVHVYYLENASAEELASTLASLTQGINKGPRPPPPPPGAPRPPATVADLFSGEVKITADKSTNSLVIIANNTDYRNLVKVVEKLDIARRQVFVEAVIMEVNLKNALDFGVSVHSGAPASVKTSDDSLVVLGSQIGSARSLSGVLSLASLGGFLAGLQGPAISDKFPIPAFSIVMHALQNSSDVNVLSTPHILTSDNEDAEITVGQNVPFQAGIASPSLGSMGGFPGVGGAGGFNPAQLLGGFGGLIAPIQRQNVELKLKIKPQINESDFIRLQIEEQTEEIAEQDQRLGPTTAKRSAKTTVVAKDQQTVVIGGLIQERSVRSVQKVPFLGDIPVLGWLFRDTSTTKIRTNLLLFLTPYIIREQRDFQRIFERKLKERQEFVEQFYGRQKGYEVTVDYTRKAGPMAKMLRDLSREAQKLENGGTGVAGEKAITPKPNDPTPSTKDPVRPNGSKDAAPPEVEVPLKEPLPPPRTLGDEGAAP
jgi:general secretion pathway protein D